ncbi:hypothetical protein [Chitinophaga sp. 212800010-3]|uniref:hypothetical protein n=1 Tax=unclassified Chitinophaga TaxID=2619133 RepID=UPI002DEB0A71|nr:putative small secreted protein [Chitinophaga sp. 212800010-3]
MFERRFKLIRDSVKSVLIVIFLSSIIAGSLFWLSVNAERNKAEKLDRINQGFNYTKGVIVNKSSYKGHSIKVRYVINETVYVYEGGWDKDPNNLSVGDSINLKYALSTPELAITELENEY